MKKSTHHKYFEAYRNDDTSLAVNMNICIYKFNIKRCHSVNIRLFARNQHKPLRFIRTYIYTITVRVSFHCCFIEYPTSGKSVEPLLYSCCPLSQSVWKANDHPSIPSYHHTTFVGVMASSFCFSIHNLYFSSFFFWLTLQLELSHSVPFHLYPLHHHHRWSESDLLLAVLQEQFNINIKYFFFFLYFMIWFMKKEEIFMYIWERVLSLQNVKWPVTFDITMYHTSSNITKVANIF